jgi:hypothetical protein
MIEPASPADLATLTHDAMMMLPPYAVLARALDAEHEDDKRLAMLDAVDGDTRQRALAYIASSRDPEVRERKRRAAWWRADVTGQRLRYLREFYARPTSVAAFISEQAFTLDPRLPERGLPAKTPFVLFPKQVEFCEWVVGLWQSSRGGTAVKPRDGGVSWLTVGIACTLALFNRDLVIGFGSRKAEYVDALGMPRSLFYKVRQFLASLEPEWTEGYVPARDALLMRITLPTGSVIVGEAGDGIGRGDRTSLYFVDEAAFLERASLVEASLAGATTNCAVWISTPNGMSGSGQVFYERSINPNVAQFRFSWRDDPRKGELWFTRMERELSPHVLAQEVLCDFSASNFGSIIPAAHIQAAIGLYGRLGVRGKGRVLGALDPADSGVDKNAFVVRRGGELLSATSWTGKNSDMLETTRRAMRIADTHECDLWAYDSVGVGAGIGGHVRSLNEKRAKPQRAQKFFGSGAVLSPGRIVQGSNGQRAEDYYQNQKAEGYDTLRQGFEASYQCDKLLKEGKRPPDALIERAVSIRADIPELTRLVAELGTPTWEPSASGRMKVDKTPVVNGVPAPSPNLADAAMMAFSGIRPPPSVHPSLLARLEAMSR